MTDKFSQLREVGIRMVQVELDLRGGLHVTYFFLADGKHDPSEPFSRREFLPGSPTYTVMEQFEARLAGFS